MPILRGLHPGGEWVHWTYLQPEGIEYLLRQGLIVANEYDASIFDLKEGGWSKKEVELMLGSIEMWSKRP